MKFAANIMDFDSCLCKVKDGSGKNEHNNWQQRSSY